MTGYEQKTLRLSHTSTVNIDIKVEVDIEGNGNWKLYRTFSVPAEEMVEHRFSNLFAAYWIRATVSKNTIATAQLTYD